MPLYGGPLLTVDALNTMAVAPQQPDLGSSVRCIHYDRTGICYFGELCTFDHSPVLEEETFEEQRQRAMEYKDQAARVTQLLASRNEEINALRLKIAEMSRAKGIAAIEKGGEGGSNPFLTRDLLALHSEAQDYYKQHGLNELGTSGVGGFGRNVRRGTRSSVVRLDNRPKRMIVAPIKAGSDEDAALRRYLEVRTPNAATIELISAALCWLQRCLCASRFGLS
jgi:hypothetical protein